MPNLELSFASGEDSLSVRRFSVHEAVSRLFSITVWARSESPTIDLEALVGKPASLRVERAVAHGRSSARAWTGICSSIEQVHAVQPAAGQKALSTYSLTLVPDLWLLTQRRNYRIFQHLTIPDITDRILAEWNIQPGWQIDRGRSPKLEYKAQYGETDYTFLVRLWEEAGFAFTFPEDGGASKLTLSDKLHLGPVHAGSPLLYADNPNEPAPRDFVTNVRLLHEVRPGAYTVRDYDFRNPGFALLGEAPKAPSPEDKYEQYHYQPGAFLIETGRGGGTPVADDKGVARHDQPFGNERTTRALGGERTGRRAGAFDTNTPELWPGVIFSIADHPHADLGESAKLLVTELSLEGAPDEAWSIAGQVVFAGEPYRPPLRTPKPRVEGVQSATVVGPPGQEIHTDEFGRVRVQFPWDREGKGDDGSSCWIRVSQGWAGTGYGMMVIPRVGQEVLVGFLEGDPDHPIIVGRVFNATQGVPYKLPEHKTRSVLRSDSSPGSGGSNEILFEDLKGSELVYMQAQKNMRQLVKNDETITVGRHRRKLVVADESETTGGNRTEVTSGTRTEITDSDRSTVIGGSEERIVGGNSIERTTGSAATLIGGDQDLIVMGDRRERIEGTANLIVLGDRREKTLGTVSAIVGGDHHEKVGKNYAVHVGEEMHLEAGTSVVIEAPDVTLHGAGGFIRIDAAGVTIKGNLVRINSGGSPASGSGAHPAAPDDAIEAVIEEPAAPEPDNVAVTGLAQ